MPRVSAAAPRCVLSDAQASSKLVPRPGAARAALGNNSSVMIEFGPYRVDGPRRVAWRGDELLPIAPKAVEILVALAERAGQVVTKDELLARVWPGVFVEEANL